MHQETRLARFCNGKCIYRQYCQQMRALPRVQGPGEPVEDLSDQLPRSVGFPCNPVCAQETWQPKVKLPSFCELNYGVSFRDVQQVDVHGDKGGTRCLFTQEERLVCCRQGYKWEFTKFLVDADGKVVKRLCTNHQPDDLKGRHRGAIGQVEPLYQARSTAHSQVLKQWPAGLRA